MDIVLRASAMFAIVFVLVRLVGKRELSEMTPFEFVMLVVIGDLIQQGVTHNDFSITGATLAVATFSFWGLVLNYLGTKSRRMEKLLDSEPSVLVRKGQLIAANLRRNRMTKHDLRSEMRLAGIAHLEEIEWGILETNGQISFIKAAGDDSPPPETSHPAE